MSDNPDPKGIFEEGGEDIPDAAPFERWLDRKLKAAYGSVLEEQIPQDIIDLLKKKLDER